jgi:hypothetical protein
MWIKKIQVFTNYGKQVFKYKHCTYIRHILIVDKNIYLIITILESKF